MKVATRPVTAVECRSSVGATVVYSYNVINVLDREIFTCRAGCTLREVAPNTKLPTVCMLNGEYILAVDWEFVELEDTDHCLFMMLPMGGGGSSSSLQTILGIVLIVVGIIYGQPLLIAAGAGLLASGLMPMPDTVPIHMQNNVDSPSPTYSINLAGNTARLGQAMPVVYGRHIIIPDFAANPYVIFDTHDNQFYHALFCFGVGDHMTVESVMIDDTNITHFVDVTLQYIGPSFGHTLTLVDPAVVTAPEVASQDLTTSDYVGPFASSGAGLKTIKIGIDIICPKGLYYADDDGNLDPKTTSWLVEARKINDAGSPAGSWTLLGNESLTLAQNSPVRRSYLYTVAAARYEVRVQRQDIKDVSSRAAHDISWAGMRSYIQVVTPLEEHANYLAVKIKATNQLSGLTQRRFSIVVRRKLEAWNGSDWDAAEETSSIAWALTDVLRNPVYGGNIPDSRIDLQSLYELDQIWTERNDQFNMVFDSRITIWDALTIIARCGRARPIMRGNVFTFVRDQAQELFTSMFNMRNVERGSFKLSYRIPAEDDPDGIEMSYFSSETWAEDSFVLPLPGTIGDPINPAKMSIKGITNLKHAQRETAYWCADAVYRPVTVSFSTELEGFLPSFGELTAIAHDIPTWGYSGEIIAVNGTTLQCSEELVWIDEDHYAIFTNAQGDPSLPVKVVAGGLPNSMTLLESPDVEFFTGTDKERTRYAMGPSESYAKLCVIAAIQPQSDGVVQMTAIVEDPRVHTADAPYVDDDGGGDGGDRIARYGEDTIPVYDVASDDQRNNNGFYADEDDLVGTDGDPGYTYD